MDPEQQTLFDWLRAKTAPRGGVSTSGLGDVAVSESGIRDLHQRLESSLGTVDLVVTNNRKRMVTAKRTRNRHRLRVHHMFVDADDEAIAALVGLARGESSSRERLREFIRANNDVIDHTPASASLRTEGSHHDLQEALDRVRPLLGTDDFDDVQITWGRDGRGQRSIRFGSYDFRQRLVRIHPALDDDWVPHYFVDFVVYHELLHVVIPPRKGSGSRRIIHPPEFRELEARFPRYDDAMTWERQNIDRFLGDRG